MDAHPADAVPRWPTARRRHGHGDAALAAGRTRRVRRGVRAGRCGHRRPGPARPASRGGVSRCPLDADDPRRAGPARAVGAAGPAQCAGRVRRGACRCVVVVRRPAAGPHAREQRSGSDEGASGAWRHGCHRWAIGRCGRGCAVGSDRLRRTAHCCVVGCRRCRGPHHSSCHHRRPHRAGLFTGTAACRAVRPSAALDAGSGSCRTGLRHGHQDGAAVPGSHLAEGLRQFQPRLAACVRAGDRPARRRGHPDGVHGWRRWPPSGRAR